MFVYTDDRSDWLFLVLQSTTTEPSLLQGRSLPSDDKGDEEGLLGLAFGPPYLILRR